MATLVLMAGLFVGILLLSALFLRLGARWVKASKAHYFRAFIATILITVMSMLVLFAKMWFQSQLGDQDTPLLVVGIGVFLIAELVASWLIIAGFVRTSFLRSIVVWLVTLMPGIAALASVYLVIRPYVLETFVVPTNAMAPTVVGWHQVSQCPNCQGELIVPAPPPEERHLLAFEREELAICTSCLKTSTVQLRDSSIQQEDRIVVNKLMRPQRWDMIVFRYPDNPSAKFLMRLVGLPGETVYIREGAIWINEVKAEPPAELAGLRYTTEVDGPFPVSMGTPEKPWRLEQDQYCVLGDFSLRSNDSRFWGPLPGSHIDGVVTLSYWPITRWKIHR
jgi:signal peptidase I